MNYSEVETKVREATNDDAWGPHGSVMKEIAQYTFTYEHFPEVLGMLWKRMLHDNKKNWRRVYKSLILLNYLTKNGSERVVTSTREHIYDLRGLENYSCTDEQGKDQGLNVRHKVKELLDFIQDDERLREERKKAKKTKDKFVGVSSDAMGYGSAYSDRYDEEPQNYHERGQKQMGEIDEWETGKKSVVSGAIDKAKDLWSRAQSKLQPENMYDQEGSHYDDDFDREKDNDNYREKNKDDWDKRGSGRDRDRYGFQDDDEEHTTVERTHTTKTEKITTNRRSRSIGKKLDLAAATGAKEGDTQSQASSTVDNGVNLFDLAQPNAGQESFADFSNFQSSSAKNDDFNPRGNSVQDFGDFTQFGTVSNSSVGGFADFGQLNAAVSAAPSTISTSTIPAAAAAAPQSSASEDLFDVFNAPTSPTLAPMQPHMGMMGGTMMMPGMTPGFTPMGMPAGMTMPMMNMGMAPGNMGVHNQGMNMMPSMMPMTSMPNMMQQPMMVQQQGMVKPGMMGTGYNHNMQKSNTWTDANSKVNISLEGLNPRNKQKLSGQGPSLNQISGGPVQSISPGMGMISPGMVGVNQGMSNMSLQSPGAGPLMGGGMSMMGAPRPMRGMGQPNMIGTMPQASMGMQMAMTSNMSGNSSFQQRTDTAFSGFGNVK
jgi:hypothetical protein